MTLDTNPFKRAWLVVVMTAGIVGSHAMAETGILAVTVREAGRETPLPCRAWVEREGERLFTPREGGCVPYGADRSFSCHGTFTMELPAGEAVLHVERGKECTPVDQAVRIEADRTQEIEVLLERWIDMQAEGWYSSDMHVHFGADDIETLRQLALADDVNWLPAFTYWNDFKKQWPDWPEGRASFADETHLVTLANEEIERIGGGPFESVGALFIFGLDDPVFVPRHDHQYPCDAALARLAKATSPNCVIDTDKPTWAENVITMGLGLFDSVQVCHNHYHREHDIPMCCGMASAEIEEEQKDWGPDELFLRTNRIYYRWLNCGFKLAVSGGSAMGVMAVPLGYNRTYAYIDGPLTESAYLEAIHAGRTFATSGPMLTLSVNGRQVGDTLAWSSSEGGSLRARALAQSIEPLESLELICNGRVVANLDLARRKAQPVLKQLLTAQITPERSGWIAARALYRAPTGRLRQAHTSPIYVTIDGKPTANRRDAEYMIRWIDRVMQVSQRPERYQTDQDRAESQAIFAQARTVYENIARTATEVWGD